MKSLLTITAVLEAGTGVALVVAPSASSVMLLDAPLDTPASLVMGRLLGAALLSIGTASWFAGFEPRGRSPTGLVAALLLYNSAVVVMLSYALVVSGLSGVGARPAIALHSSLACWCFASLRVVGGKAGAVDGSGS